MKKQSAIYKPECRANAADLIRCIIYLQIRISVGCYYYQQIIHSRVLRLNRLHFCTHEAH